MKELKIRMCRRHRSSAKGLSNVASKDESSHSSKMMATPRKRKQKEKPSSPKEDLEISSIGLNCSYTST